MLADILTKCLGHEKQQQFWNTLRGGDADTDAAVAAFLHGPKPPPSWGFPGTSSDENRNDSRNSSASWESVTGIDELEPQSDIWADL